ncbi:MAG: hypothetical protein ACKVPJ_13515 [Chitinophagales bacterium]
MKRLKKKYRQFLLTVTISDVLRTDGLDNLPGIQPDILYNVGDNLTTIPDLPASPTTDTERVTIDDDFVIVAGKPFKKLEVTQGTGQIKGEWIGDRDGGQFKQTCEGWIKKSVAATAMFRLMANSDGYFVVTDMNGTKHSLGSLKSPAHIEMSETDGGREGEEKGPGYKFMITAFSAVPDTLFTGAAPIA